MAAMFLMPFQFAEPPRIHTRFRRTRELWAKVAHIYGRAADSEPEFFLYNPVPKDPALWGAVVMGISTETPEGEALHLSYRIHRTDSVHEQDVRDAECRFAQLLEEYPHWRDRS